MIYIILFIIISTVIQFIVMYLENRKAVKKLRSAKEDVEDEIPNINKAVA
jgi:uncharacterized membrane protein YsdA (DUF1294 family)